MHVLQANGGRRIVTLPQIVTDYLRQPAPWPRGDRRPHRDDSQCLSAIARREANMGTVHRLAHGPVGPALGAAADAFLAELTNPNTTRAYTTPQKLVKT